MGSAGFHVLRRTEAHPTVNSPSARQRAVPSEGEGASAFPPRTPPCRGRRERVAWLLPTFKLTCACVRCPGGQLHSRRQCSPSGRSTPENTSGVFVPPYSLGAAFSDAAILPRLAARSRSHAGCALAGDPLAICVCKQKPIETI